MKLSMTGQYIQKDSFIHALDARVKLTCFFLLAAVMILAKTYVQYALAFAMLLLSCALSRLSYRALTATIARMWSFLILIFLMNALFFSAEDPIWKWWIFTLSMEGIAQGAHLIAHVVLVLVLSNLLTCTTTPIQITSALESLMRPLRFIGIPVETIALVLSMSLSFIPTLLQEADTIRKAQIARGARFESRNLIEKAQSFLPLILPLFLCAFRRADDLALAMEARGYKSAKQRTKKASASLQKGDYFTLAICTFILVLQIIF